MAAPVEAKVKASTAAAAVAGLALWLLSRYVFHGGVPPFAQAEIYVVAPAVVTFAAGWFAKHTPRPGVPAAAPQVPASGPPLMPPPVAP